MLPTIFAQSTPAGRSAISVLRIAGPEALAVMRQLAPQAWFRPREARVTRLYKPAGPGAVPSTDCDAGTSGGRSTARGTLLDEALVTYFRGPNSYTGEDVVELSLHGSPAVSRAVQAAINATRLARHAEPGEFTKRAFSNRRLDLSQVEGIRDLLAAETEMQRHTAVSGAAGELSRAYEKWRADLVECSALLTATIDFMEDNGLEEDHTRARVTVDRVRSEIAAAAAAATQCAELVKSGVRVALLGAPNAGKSSLTNRLVQRTACIVSDIPGTTRDVLEVALEIRGHKVVLSDTAGIRATTDEIETLGIERARAVLDEAQIVLALLPPDGTSADVLAEIDRLCHSEKTVLIVGTKSDLGGSAPCMPHADAKILRVSSLTGEGMDTLVEAVGSVCDALIGTAGIAGDASGPSAAETVGMGISERARSLLETQVLPGLDACLDLLDSDVVLANAELQLAVEGIGLITGRSVSIHEVLDVLFGEFCIGK